VHETDSLGGSRQQITPYTSASIIVGRGGTSQILLESQLVSLEHLWITIESAALQIKDLGSHSGTWVNNRRISNAEVSAGDVIKLGDVVFTVGKDDQGWFLERQASAFSAGTAEQLQKIVRNVEASYNLPSVRVLSILVVTVVTVYAYIIPAAEDNLALWAPGPISTQHQMLQGKCAECHQKLFHPVPNSACTQCHSLSEHIPLGGRISQDKLDATTNALLARDCTDCHREHRGSEGMTLSDNRLCVQCHQAIGNILENPTVQSVPSFAKHPEFTVPVRQDSADKAAVKQVQLSDAERLRDTTRLKLNHKLHLKPQLRGANGPVTLSCESCHTLREDRKVMLPISFNRDCRSCHPLGFDDRFPGKEAPHASPDIVYNFLYAESAKLALAKTAEQLSSRELPGRTPVRDESAIALAEREITREARHTESELFERTGCVLCHEISKASASRSENISDDDTGVSAFTVLTPEIPKIWMSAARFDHGAHLAVRCESCHEGSARSTDTADVLLPDLKTCQSCHGDPESSGKVSSNCVMCHSHHDSLLLKYDRKRQIEQILHGGTPMQENLAEFLRRYLQRKQL
jgi:predicted CXXCH cytochrome family protein